MGNEAKRRILNVGCGYDTYGTDFLDLYPSRKEIKKCNFDTDKFPYKDNTFDEIFSKNNFEHLQNPKHFLNESRRVLKRGGRVVIITDNAAYHGFFGRAHHGWHEEMHKDHPDDRHYALFTPTHLKNWLEMSGFRDIKSQYMVANPKDRKSAFAAALNRKLSQSVMAIGIK